MRKINSAIDEEKLRKRSAWAIGLVMIFLMLFSTAGYALFSGGFSGSSSENDENLNYDGNYYNYEKNGQQFYFINPISVASNVPVDIDFELNDYYGQQIYIISDEGKSLNEISLNLDSTVSRMQEACYGACDKDLPEKQCDEKLIVWRDSEENRVYQEEQCVFIEGDIVAMDAFLYKLIGIE